MGKIQSIGKFRNDNNNKLNIKNPATAASAVSANATNATYENGQIVVDIAACSKYPIIISGIKQRLRIIDAWFLCKTAGATSNTRSIYNRAIKSASYLAAAIAPTMAARGRFNATTMSPVSNIIQTSAIAIVGAGAGADTLAGTLVISVQPY
jgi:hypothetical protein